jgi:hypothetical protein
MAEPLKCMRLRCLPEGAPRWPPYFFHLLLKGCHEINDTPAVTAGGLALGETDRLIASDKVEDTPVYNPKDEHWGRCIT